MNLHEEIPALIEQQSLLLLSLIDRHDKFEGDAAKALAGIINIEAKNLLAFTGLAVDLPNDYSQLKLILEQTIETH